MSRWRTLLTEGRHPASEDLDTLDEAAIRESVKQIAVAGNTGHYVDIPGTNGNRIVAVIVVRGKELWFFKMMGDEQLVGAQRDAFEAFVK